MAILLLIKNINEGFTYLNDVVGVYRDDHVFSQTELDWFNFLTVNGSREDVQAILQRIQPEVKPAFYYNDEWNHHPPVNPDDLEDEITIYRIEGTKRWYKLVNPFKFMVNIGELTVEEKTLLETYDITHSSVDSFIKKICKDITSDPANNVEITDLRNINP